MSRNIFLCDLRNRRKEDEKFEIWKYGCTNANEPDWDSTTTTSGWSTTTTLESVVIELGFQIDIW